MAQVQIASRRYATAIDHYRIFFEEMGGLYWLAFLLTASRDMAEQCLAGGLGKCIDRVDVLLEQAPSWARLAVIKEAIRIFEPVPGKGKEEFIASKLPAAPKESNPFAFIVSLCTFERFVFVLSILEGVPDLDCENLLGCSWEDVVMSRKAATKLFGATSGEIDCAQEDRSSRPKLLHWPRR